MEKKKTKRKIFESKRVVLLAAFMLAVLSWIIVAGFIDPGDSLTITGIRIDYTHSENSYKNKNLQIVSDQKSESYAEVTVSGDGSAISGLGSSDITVYPDYSTVSGPGEYVLPLKAEKIRQQGNYSITDISVTNSQHSLRRSPQNTVTIVFEEITSKSLPVTVEAEGVTAAEGFFRGDPVAIPAEVTITGPKSEVTRVVKVVAEVDDEEIRSEPVIFNGIQLILYDANDQVVESQQITISPVDSVEVDIPIMATEMLDLTVSLTGVPQGFDSEWLQSLLHLSTEQLQVVGTSATLANLSNPYPVYVIDISELTLGWTSEPFEIELPEGVRNLGQQQAAVSLDSETLVEKDFDVTNIRVINTPRNTTITPVSDTVQNVTLIGPADQIDALLPENIIIEIDAFDITAPKTGQQQTIPARVLVPGQNRVFASGSYPVVCNLTVDSNAASA